MRISYSGSNLFQGCQRRFWHYKIAETPHDSDFRDESAALRLGKAFHQVLEHTMHKKSRLKKEIFQESFNDNEVLSDTERGLIYGMVHKYLQLHEKSGLTVKAVEVQVGNENYIGYVDAIMVDTFGNWWIVDLKTAARLSGSLLSRLSRDPQLNAYSYFKEQIADLCDLDVAKFAGVRYRVTTKAAIKLNIKESFTKFCKRVFDKVESYDIGIPAQDLNPEAVYSHFMNLLKQMVELETTPEKEVPQNYTYCETYFKPCPWWSNCYGKTFTEAAKQYDIRDSTDIVNLSIDELDYI